MPTFSFSSVKKKEKRKTNSHTKQYEVILKSVEGVVFINEKAEFLVFHNGTYFQINKSCYSCKGKERIYKLGYDKPNKYSFTRALEDYKDLGMFGWTPFTVGSIVKGNVVVNSLTNHYSFIIKKEWMDYTNELSQKAHNYYKEHYDEINKIIKERYECLLM